MSSPRSLAAGRLVLAVALLLPAAAGCGTVQKVYNDVTSNHYYQQDGYRVDGPYAFFVHAEKPLQNTMELGFGYGRKKLTDKECDGTVDLIEFKEEQYHRGDAGSEDLFKQADEEWAWCYEKMHIASADAKWREMNASNIAQTAGYSNYKH